MQSQNILKIKQFLNGTKSLLDEGKNERHCRLTLKVTREQNLKTKSAKNIRIYDIYDIYTNRLKSARFLVDLANMKRILTGKTFTVTNNF